MLLLACLAAVRVDRESGEQTHLYKSTTAAGNGRDVLGGPQEGVVGGTGGVVGGAGSFVADLAEEAYFNLRPCCSN